MSMVEWQDEPERQSLSVRLRQSFPTLAESLDSDDALPYVPVSVATRALQLVGPECEPASHDELVFAFGWLASVTTGDKTRSPEVMQISARALAEAMREYPRAAALEAIRDWPKTEGGKWWPTENELRREAEQRGWRSMRLNDHLRAVAMREDVKAPRSNEPSAALRPYLEECAALFGSGFIKSWLSPLTCQFQGKTIWTHPLGQERLTERTARQLLKHDVVIRSDESARQHFRSNTDHIEEFKFRSSRR